MRRVAVIAALALAMAGCASFERFAESLNERQVASCISWRGGMRAGLVAGGQLAVDAVSATGGAVMEECVAHLRGR